MRFLILCLGLFVITSTVLAGKGGVSVESAYIRELLPGRQITAAFMTITNNNDSVCTLVGVSSPVAERAELHGHFHDNGMMRMRPVGNVELAPGESMVLQPGGYHVMLFGVAGEISDSEHYALTLYFENCPKVNVMAEVRKLL